jgi:hypothetical protein
MTQHKTLGVVMIRILLLAIVGRFALVSSTNLMTSSSYVLTTYRGGQQQYEGDSELRENRSQEILLFSNSSIDIDDDDDDDESSKESKRRKRFLNRMAAASSMLLRREHDAKLADGKGDSDEDQDGITPQSDLSRPGRYIHIVTTASLPWFTGTAVNPLLRAAYLHDRLQQINSGGAGHNNNSTGGKTSWVTLVIPWLELPEDQQKLYNGRVFNSTQEQEAFVREWLANSAHMPDAAQNLNIVFYNARYHEELGSVFAMGDIIQQLPQDELDVCILEEPEVRASLLSFVGFIHKCMAFLTCLGPHDEACQLVPRPWTRVDQTIQLCRRHRAYKL